MANDFDDVENEIDEESLNDGDNTSFPDINSLEELEDELNDNKSFSDSKGTVNNEDTQIEFAPAPKNSEAVENTFKDLQASWTSIYNSSYEMTVVVKEAIGVTQNLINQYKETAIDVQNIYGIYNNVHAKLEQTLSTTQAYFTANVGVVNGLSAIEEKTSETLKSVNSALLNIEHSYRTYTDENLKKITDAIESLSSGIDIAPVQKNIQEQVSKYITDSSLKSLHQSIDNFDKIYFDLEDVVNRLQGKKEEKGLFKDFVDDVEKFASEIKDIKKGFKWSVVINFSACSFFIGSILTYFMVNSDTNDMLNKALQKQAIEIQTSYSDKLLELKTEHRSYTEFRKKYNLENNSELGFGFSDDTNEPYFYFPENKKTVRYGDKIYIILGDNKK
jgi:hypothetical protein